jgi:hypothetical protein
VLRHKRRRASADIPNWNLLVQSHICTMKWHYKAGDFFYIKR